jgi:hypothetical protein
MRKRIWLILLVASTLMVLLTAAVLAQNTVIDDDGDVGAAFVQIEPFTATVRQLVPVSVTVRIPLGTTETQTVTIPMLLNLNLQLSLGELVSPSLVLTAAVDTVGPLTPTLATAQAGSTATIAAPTPTAVPPTATPLPPSPTPTLTPVVPETTTTTVTVTTTETTTETTETATSPVTDTTTVLVPECTDPRSLIVFPGVDQTIAGTVEVLGSATHESFQYYKLEYATGANASPAAEYFYLGGGNSPVENGVLATIDVSALANDAYTLKLTVVDATGNFPTPCTVTVQVQN